MCAWVGWVCSWEDLVKVVLGLRIEDRFYFFILNQIILSADHLLEASTY